MRKVKLNIMGMSYSQSQSGAYALIMGEEDGGRKLPIIIGSFEAQSIAIKLENIETSRPLTHDLFTKFTQSFDISIEEIVINKFIDGVFHAELVCSFQGNTIRVDSRTSDAVAIALRTEAPIFTTEEIMEKASIIIDQDEESSDIKSDKNPEVEDQNPYSKFNLKELEKKLQTAIEREEFEKASEIRDEIQSRKKKNQ